SIVFVFFIAKRYFGSVVAFLSAAIFTLLPFNVFFSRTTLPEPTFLFFALGMVYFVDKWIGENKKKWGIWGFIFTTIAFLIKPWAIFFIPPLIYLILKKEKKVKAIFKYLLFFVLAISPFLLWRLWILQFPEGIPASNWLLNGDGIRLRPAFFWWLVQQRLGGEILGVSGLILFLIGIIVKPKNGSWFPHIWAISLIFYLIVVATGNVRHNYYQLILTPVLSIFMARGFVYLFKGNTDFIPRILTIGLALLLLPLSFYFGWKYVKEFYKINNPPIIEAGKRADMILPKESMVVAPYNGDTAFLYQINRPGWAVTAFPLKEMVADFGVTYYISVNKDDKTNWVKRHFFIVEETGNYVIADLTKLKEKFDEKKDPEP
ncbi:MAG: glycosyltransferase family 39 protein, partial [Candidatus Daviesbacteria bacterium]|nr:glycosyltransferase family 39 protein [Candidatus Daviesbacteria bacterium]